MLQIFKLLMLFITPFSLINRIDILNSNQYQPFPQTLYLEGKPATFFKGSVPFIYIEIISKKDVYGYMGYYAIKSKGFDGLWKFKLYETKNGYYSDLMPQTSFDTTKLSRIYIENKFNVWKIKTPETGKVYNLNLLPKNYDNKIRKYIYALATFEVYIKSKWPNENFAWYFYSSYKDESIFDLNFFEMSKKIDEMSFEELKSVLHIRK